MYVESKEDWVPGDHHRTKWHRNRRGESGWSTQLARTQKYERYKKILRPYKLLQKVYQGFCMSSKANKCANKERYEVVMGARTAKGI